MSNNNMNATKASIIVVHGNALDKIGFSIAERANRSAELRLDKTIRSINVMEQRDVTKYRKQKYDVQTQLDRLKGFQKQVKRDYMRRTASFGEGLCNKIKGGLEDAALMARKTCQRSKSEEAMLDADDDNASEFPVNWNEAPTSAQKSKVLLSKKKDILNENQALISSTHVHGTPMMAGGEVGDNIAPRSSISIRPSSSRYMRSGLADSELNSGGMGTDGNGNPSGKGPHTKPVIMRPRSAEAFPRLPKTSHLVTMVTGEGTRRRSDDTTMQSGRNHIQPRATEIHNEAPKDREPLEGSPETRTPDAAKRVIVPVPPRSPNPYDRRPFLKRTSQVFPCLAAEDIPGETKQSYHHHGYDNDDTENELEDSLKSSTGNDVSPPTRRRRNPNLYNSYGFFFSREELLQILLEEQRELQIKIKQFLAKSNPQ